MADVQRIVDGATRKHLEEVLPGAHRAMVQDVDKARRSASRTYLECGDLYVMAHLRTTSGISLIPSTDWTDREEWQRAVRFMAHKLGALWVIVMGAADEMTIDRFRGEEDYLEALRVYLDACAVEPSIKLRDVHPDKVEQVLHLHLMTPMACAMWRGPVIVRRGGGEGTGWVSRSIDEGRSGWVDFDKVEGRMANFVWPLPVSQEVR